MKLKSNVKPAWKKMKFFKLSKINMNTKSKSVETTLCEFSN